MWSFTTASHREAESVRAEIEALEESHFAAGRSCGSGAGQHIIPRILEHGLCMAGQQRCCFCSVGLEGTDSRIGISTDHQSDGAFLLSSVCTELRPEKVENHQPAGLAWLAARAKPPTYTISKSALVALTRSLAIALAAADLMLTVWRWVQSAPSEG